MAEPSESFLVFSDVHLGSDLDDCQGNAPRRSSAVDADLVALVAHYRKTPPNASRWHIVVAGDFIDFIGMTIAPPNDGEAPGTLSTELTEEERAHGLGGAADHAREKLRRVARRHADVFAELAAFVADGHALTLVHGNHDIELHWDEVQDDFRRILVEHADPLDRDAFLARIAFNPWFFWRDGVAFIEHGHQYDPFCATTHVMAPLSPLDPRRIARGFCEVLLRYVVRPTRGMTESGHENVGLAHYLRFGAQLGLRGMLTLGMRFGRAVRELFRVRAESFSDAANALRAEHDKRIAQLAKAKRIGVDRLRRLLELQSLPITTSIAGIMASVLLDRLALACASLLAMSLIAVAGSVFGFTPWAFLLVAPVWALLHVRFARRRQVDPSVQLADRAAHLAKLFPAAFIVMGHTHVPQSVRAGDATYINVGSWAEHEDEGERAARTHLVIHVTSNGAEAHFRTWGPTGPRPASMAEVARMGSSDAAV